MADKKKMSVEDILAACRTPNQDGGNADAPAEPVAETPSKPAASPDSPAPKPSAGGKPGAMSAADVLAAARGGGGHTKPETAADAPKPTVSGGAPAGKKPSQMSVEEMLAAARSGKSKDAPAAKPAGKGADKPAASKAQPVEKGKAKPASSDEPRDTSSILAAARKAVKPGPMSKAEAAAKGKTVPKAKTAPPMPEKPAYAKPVAPRTGVAKGAIAEATRRGFFARVGGFFSWLLATTLGSFLAVGFTSLAVVGGLWTLGFAKFMFPNILTEPPSRFKVGFPADFSADSVTTKFKAQFGVWVVNSQYEGVQMITALKSVCTHLGCTPNWLEGEQKFKCPCHGSGFYKDGINFEGPAPRPLERYAIRIADDGQLEIDKSKTFQEEMGAWSEKASYVPV